MSTFKEQAEADPKMVDEYTQWAKSQSKDAPPDWEAFRKEYKDAPAQAPSDLLDIHAKVMSGTLGSLLGTVTDTVGGVTGGLLGGQQKSER